MLTPKHESSSDISGYLVKASRVLVRRKSFFRLNGSVLSQLKKEAPNAKLSMSINIAGALVVKHGRNGIAIVSNGEHLILYAKNENEFGRWFQALTTASEHRLEKYYLIRGVLGQGGFATVRLGYDKTTRGSVAIKSIEKSGSSPVFLRREVEVLKTVSHPNIVETFDVFETEHKFHIVMEYMRGGMLLDSMNGRHTLSEVETRHVISQILEGVFYLHEKGIVHRDLKPENVLITRSGTLGVKLADFGLATFHEANSERLMSTLIGTPQFVAPELVQNEAYGIEVDLWAVGIILYFLLAGKMPFEEEDVIRIYASGKFEIPYSHHKWGKVSAEARSLTMQLLCKDPSRRVSAIGALQHDWFSIPLRTDTMGKNGIDYQSWKKAKAAKTSLLGWTPFNTLRKTVHIIRFLLRLTAKAGFISTFAVSVLPLNRSESFVSVGSGSSCQSSNLSDWDFQPKDFELQFGYEASRSGSIVTKKEGLEPGRTVANIQNVRAAQTTQLLQALEVKLANAELECPGRRSNRTQRNFAAPNIEMRALSVGRMGMSTNEFGSLSMGSSSSRAASERPKQNGTSGCISTFDDLVSNEGTCSLNDENIERYSCKSGEEVLSLKSGDAENMATRTTKGTKKGEETNMTKRRKNRSKGTKLTKARNWFVSTLGGMKGKDSSPQASVRV